jgi:hypothetical protein
MPDTYDNLLEQISDCAAALVELQRLSAQTCAPVVHDLIRTRSQDAHAIEHTLDRLLDCACHPEGLVLFKTLCRYYFTLDPAATADYIRIFREMWDDDAEEGPEMTR